MILGDPPWNDVDEKIGRMRGSLRVRVEAQFHRGTIGIIISGFSSVYAPVHAIVIVCAIVKQCTVENLQAMMSGCFGD